MRTPSPSPLTVIEHREGRLSPLIFNNVETSFTNQLKGFYYIKVFFFSHKTEMGPEGHDSRMGL